MKNTTEMKTFGKIIYLCGIMMFKLMLCSADDALTEAQLKKIYKFNTAENETVNTRYYKIIYGETIKKPPKKVMMKMEIPIKKRTGEDREESYVSREIKIFKDLQAGNTHLLSEGIAEMLHHGYYDGKRVLITPRRGNNLILNMTKPYSWDEISQIGPCMIKALRLLHNKHYVLQLLAPQVFSFGTEEKQSSKKDVLLKNQVYLFDIGLAEKYRDSNGSHRAYEKAEKFIGVFVFASRSSMTQRMQSRRDDIESLYYLISFLSGILPPRGDDTRKLISDKDQFCRNSNLIKSIFLKRNDTHRDVRVLNAILDFQRQLNIALFNLFYDQASYELEPEYDDFINCFDQGLSEEEIRAKYIFINSNEYEGRSFTAFIAPGNTTDPNNKMEVVMKLMKESVASDSYIMKIRAVKREIGVYRDLKKGTKHSLIREHICEMLDYGIYSDRIAIIMTRLGADWYEEKLQNFPNGYPFKLLCVAARCAIGALRFIHNSGYLHCDIKPHNFAFGTVDSKKSVRSQADKPLKERLYLLDFGASIKWRYANGTHLPRTNIGHIVGTNRYFSRTAIKHFSQSRRDDMESLFFALLITALNKIIFNVDKGDADDATKKLMLSLRNELVTNSSKITETFKPFRNVSDPQELNAFINYAAELNKLFVSDAPEYFEKEPDYNAFCVCFGGKPGDNACDVE